MGAVWNRTARMSKAVKVFGQRRRWDHVEAVLVPKVETRVEEIIEVFRFPNIFHMGISSHVDVMKTALELCGEMKFQFFLGQRGGPCLQSESKCRTSPHCKKASI